MLPIKLRPHQAEAIAQLKNLNRGDSVIDYFDRINKGVTSLLELCPAAGKTILGCEVFRLLKDGGVCNRVIVIGPANVANGWKAAFRKMGIQVTSKLGNSGIVQPGISGYVTNFQAVNAAPDVHRQRCLGMVNQDVRTLVIIDEVHHLADCDDNGKPQSWGVSHKYAFTGATRVLCLSGTPYRTKTTEAIPFVEYALREGGGFRLNPDYSYGLGRGINDQFLRQPVAVWMDGSQEFQRTPGEHDTEVNENGLIDYETTLEEADGSPLESAALGNYIDTCNTQAIDAGYEKLRELRLTDPRAKILIVCDNKNHAERAAAHATNHSTGKPALIISDSEEGGSLELIDAFRDSSNDTAVSIDILSEGVDIPDLRVLVWLTRKRTLLRLCQTVGRVLRVRDSAVDPRGVNTQAYVIFPRMDAFMLFMRSIEEAVEQYVKPVEEKKEGGGGSSPILSTLITGKGDASHTHSTVSTGSGLIDIAPHEAKAAEAYCRGLMSPAVFSRLTLAEWYSQWILDGSPVVEAPPQASAGVDDIDAVMSGLHAEADAAFSRLLAIHFKCNPNADKSRLPSLINGQVNSLAGIKTRAKGQVDVAGLKRWISAAKQMAVSSTVKGGVA